MRFLIVLLAGLLLIQTADARFVKRPGFVTAAFDGDCEKLIADQIQSARRELLVAIYIMTRPRIGNLIVAAHQRGVNVRIKYDVNQAKLESMQAVIEQFDKHGIECKPITLERSGASMHNKFIVVDGLRVITGSYNFTAMANSFNYENCLLIESSQTAKEFSDVFETIADR
jgi:mitochondrial cardiolipin hydrolase